MYFENWNFLAFLSLKSKKNLLLRFGKWNLWLQTLKALGVFLRAPLRVFHHCFFRCFHFTTEFYYCWLHLFISSTLGFFITVSSDVFISRLILTIVFRMLSFHQLSLPWLCQVLRFMLLYRECYGFERTFFTLRRFLPYSPSRHLAQRDVAPACIYQGFPESRQFFLEGCRTSDWVSKHRPSPSVCLNLIVLSKRY